MKIVPIQIYADDKMERLYRAALRILNETGFSLDDEFLLGEFEKRGMRVDRSKKRISVRESLIEELLAPSVTERNPGEWLYPRKLDIGGSFPKFYDWASRSSQMGTTELQRELIRTFNAIDDYGSVGRILTLCDVEQSIEPIISTALLIKTSPRPGQGEVYNANNIPYLIELGEIATGKANCTDFVASPTFCVPPLKLTKDECGLIIAKAKAGMRAHAGTMPCAGATSPITREGTCAIEIAEIIMIWLCYRLVNPAAELESVCASSSLDMKTGECSFSSPEAILQDCATVQILRRYFDCNSYICNGYVDAKLPGMQSVYEGLFKAWWALQFTGTFGFGSGLLQAGRTFCPAQCLLEREIWQSFSAIFADGPAFADEVPFEEISTAVHCGGSFLESEHTLRLFRQTGFAPSIFDRSPYQDDFSENRKALELMDRAQEQYDNWKAKFQEFMAEPAICRAVDDVVKRARVSLC